MLRRSRWLPGICVLEPPKDSHPCEGSTCAVLAPDVPEPRHPTSSAGIQQDSCFDVLFVMSILPVFFAHFDFTLVPFRSAPKLALVAGYPCSGTAKKRTSMCRLDVRVRPPWMAGVSKMQEQFIDLAPDVPEPGHPTPSADIALGSCFDTLFENIFARLKYRCGI